MKLRLIAIFLGASLSAAQASAEYTVQCHQGSDGVKPGFTGGVDGVNPAFDGTQPKRREPDGVRPGFDGRKLPDQVTGSTDGSDRVAPSFENQSLDGEQQQQLTPEERKARREARRKAIREKIAAFKAKIQQYIQSNSNGNALGSALGDGSIQSLQTAFEEFKRSPASLGPAPVTPSVNYETINPGGVSGAR